MHANWLRPGALGILPNIFLKVESAGPTDGGCTQYQYRVGQKSDTSRTM